MFLLTARPAPECRLRGDGSCFVFFQEDRVGLSRLVVDLEKTDVGPEAAMT